MNAKRKQSGFDFYVFLMLVALEFLMSFTFLGYIHIPPISITTAYIPILLAACLLDIPHSTFIGMIFGLCSVYKATASYVMPADMVFSPFMSGHPIKSLLLSVGTRTLFGFLIGWLFSLAKKSRHERTYIGLLTLCANKLQAFLVFGALGILFPEIGYHASSAVPTTGHEILFSLFCVVLVEILQTAYRSQTVQRIRFCVNQSTSKQRPSHSLRKAVFLVTFLILCATVTAAIYFTQRTTYMLGKHDIEVSSVIHADLLHLQAQFLMATLSLNVFLLMLFLTVYQYMSYQEYIRELDMLTGVMGRRLFLYSCTNFQEQMHPEKGWFLFLDVDSFKTINDTFGHPVGDKVLREIADGLKRVFSAYGAVGRVGGDEFAIMIEESMSEEDLREKLNRFQAEIADILPEFRKISCSIGVCQFDYPQDMQTLLTQTDKILYQAKERGRDCYVIGALNEKEVH